MYVHEGKHARNKFIEFKHTIISNQSNQTVSITHCLALAFRHRDEVLLVQEFLRQGSPRQLWIQDGMLFQ